MKWPASDGLGLLIGRKPNPTYKLYEAQFGNGA